MEKETNEQK